MNIEEKVKENLPKIKELLFGKQAAKFEDVKKADGAILRIEPAIEVGAAVNVIGEDGEVLPAPDGDHELESGSVIKVEGGLIVEVMEVAPEPQPEQPMSAEPAPAPTQTLNMEEIQNAVLAKLNESIANKINNLKFAAVEEVETLKTENAKLKEALSAVADLVEELSKQPAAEPKKKVSNPFKAEKPQTNKLETFIKSRKNIK